MQLPTTPYQPYAAQHAQLNGPGDARPTAMQIMHDCDAIGKLKGKTVLITGCSSGIGTETARALYAGGARLFLTGRDTAKLGRVIDGIVDTVPDATAPRPEALELHLESLDGMRRGADEFARRVDGRLHVLINNAGVMAAPYGHTADGFETHMGTNHFAHFLLFHRLKPLLLRAAEESGQASRVINVSSAGHRYSMIRFDDMDFQDASQYKWPLGYGQSKTANIYMASSIARRYASRNMVGLSVHPGAIWTELGRHMAQAERDQLFSNQVMWKSLEQGAATTVWAAVSPYFEGKNGGRYLADVGECGPLPENPVPAQPGYAQHIYNEEAEERLWRLSCEAVGVSDDK